MSGEMNRGMTRREREVTEEAKIRRILETCKIVHLGLVDKDRPYVVPMNYGFEMEDGRLTLYVHGALKGYKLDLMRENPNVFFEMECDVQPFEGSVACKYGMAYSSIMGRGTAHMVEDVEEKKKALSLIMKAQTGGDFTFEDKMTTIVSVIRIDVSSYTAKHRPLPEKRA